jgi:hypothetical protein
LLHIDEVPVHLTTDTLPQTQAPVRWRLGTRVAFRFCVVYFTLYVLSTQMLGGLMALPLVNIPPLESLPPIRNMIEWTARHVFGITTPLVLFSGSGDKTFDWVHVFCFLVIASIATIIWSWLDRRRERYTKLQAWFRLFMRFSLGSTMLSYGMVKAIPLQMPAPTLARLLEPYGQFSPMGVLWASIGSSRSYEIFTGCAELTAAILLFIPGITTFAALVCFAVSMHVFVLNMTYDVPVKLFAFHLMVMALVLLAPEAKRLASFLLLDRATPPSALPPLSQRPRVRRALAIAQVVFGLYLIGMNVYGANQRWWQFGGGAPKSPLYGIWTVETMAIDGVIRAPLVTDYDRWRRLTFQTPTSMSFHRMDDTFVRYTAAIDTGASTLTLSAPTDKNFNARFAFTRPAPDRLTLDGKMNGHAIRMDLKLLDHTNFLLVSRGFQWVQEVPFNR